MDTKQLITGNPKEGFYPIVQDTVTVIELNKAVLSLTSESSSEDIIAAFDSVEDFTTLLQNVRNTENIVNGVLVNDSSLIGKIFCNIIAHTAQETLYIDGVFTNQYFNITITNTDGTFSCVKNVVYLNSQDNSDIFYIDVNDISDNTYTSEKYIALNNAMKARKTIIRYDSLRPIPRAWVATSYYVGDLGELNVVFIDYNNESKPYIFIMRFYGGFDNYKVETKTFNLNLITNGDGSKFLSDDGTYKTIEVGDKTNVLILSLENDLANGQKDSPVTAEVSTALKDAISTGKACVIKSTNSDILANLQQIGDNVTIIMEQISRVGQTFVAVNTTITVNTVTNVISDYQTGAIVLETEGDGNKFLSNDGSYKELQQIKGGTAIIGLDKTSEAYPGIVLGELNEASGETSIAGGSASIASANFSTALGRKCVVSGNYGVALGYKSVASGLGSLALGYTCVASGDRAISTGGYNINIYLVSTEGTNRYYVNGGTNFNNPAYDINRIQVGVEIISKTDSGNIYTTVTKVELIDNVIYIETKKSLGTFETPTVCGIGSSCAIGVVSFSANASCAVGRQSAAFAFGYAGGNYSFAAGDYSYAYGEYSSTFGQLTESWNNYECSIGRANKSTQSDDESIATRFTIGIGSGTNYSNAVRKNAVEIKANGDGYIIGVGNYDGTNAEDENTKTIQEVLNGVVTSDNVLTKDNTTEFTPTGDYQPSTKKYVDDNVSRTIANTNKGKFNLEYSLGDKSYSDTIFYDIYAVKTSNGYIAAMTLYTKGLAQIYNGTYISDSNNPMPNITFNIDVVYNYKDNDNKNLLLNSIIKGNIRINFNFNTIEYGLTSITTTCKQITLTESEYTALGETSNDGVLYFVTPD